MLCPRDHRCCTGIQPYFGVSLRLLTSWTCTKSPGGAGLLCASCAVCVSALLRSAPEAAILLHLFRAPDYAAAACSSANSGRGRRSSELDDEAFAELLKENKLTDDEVMARARLNSIQADPERARLQNRVKAAGFYLQDNDNTGHCMFDAMRIQINERFPEDRKKYKGKPGADYMYKEVRRDAADWLRLNQDFELQPGDPLTNFWYDDLGNNWEDFCDRVQHFLPKRTMRAVQWGEHIHLIALANAYKRPIRVWTSRDGNEWWHEIHPKDGDKNKTPFDIAHEFERHYLSVLPRHIQSPDGDPQVWGASVDKKKVQTVKAKKAGFRDTKKAHATSLEDHLTENVRAMHSVDQGDNALFAAIADQINRRFPELAPARFGSYWRGTADVAFVREKVRKWLLGLDYYKGRKNISGERLAGMRHLVDKNYASHGLGMTS